MDKCLFCKGDKDISRPKYCSKQCIKRAWQVRRNPDLYWGTKKHFWLSDTGTGLKWELYAAEKLGGKHLLFNNNGSDILKDGKTYDVKVSALDKRKNKRGKPVKGTQKGYWVFKTGNKNIPDYFYCICLDKDSVVKELCIPTEGKKSKGISIGWKSRYDIYRVD